MENGAPRLAVTTDVETEKVKVGKSGLNLLVVLE